MAKSLGQIHTVNLELQNDGEAQPKFICDTAGELTTQLSHMVRMGNSFKCVGIDMSLIDYSTGDGGQSVSGRIRYYAPTRGRVLAIRDAWHAVRKAMDVKGINPRSNQNYDFRPILRPPETYENGGDVKNIATIQFDYDNRIWKPLCIDDNPGWQTIFDTWNAQLEPRQGRAGAPQFSTGYDVQLGGEMFRTTGVSTGERYSVNPDFVLEEAMLLQTPRNFASDQMEEIPFTMTNSDGDSPGITFQWRPDPALYLAVLTGQFEIVVDEFKGPDGGHGFFQLDVAIYISGWSGIMSDRKHKSKSKKSKRKSKKSKR